MTITHPTWVYSRTAPARIVTTQADYDALGEGWTDSPAAFTEPADTTAPVVARTPRGRRAKETTT